MKHTARVISLLLLVFGLCLVPVSGAAGDPADTGDTSTSDTGSGNGDGSRHPCRKSQGTREKFIIISASKSDNPADSRRDPRKQRQCKSN